MKYQRGFFDFFSFIVLTSIILSCKVCLVVFFFIKSSRSDGNGNSGQTKYKCFGQRVLNYNYQIKRCTYVFVFTSSCSISFSTSNNTKSTSCISIWEDIFAKVLFSLAHTSYAVCHEAFGKCTR